MSNRLSLSISILLAAAFLFIIVTSPGTAQNSGILHHQSSEASQHRKQDAGNAAPVEGGHAAFAAISELVARFEQDDGTNWSQINITALHEHLKDMDNIMLNSVVDQQVVESGEIQFDVRGQAESDAIASIQRMATAHGLFIKNSRGWNITTTPHDYGVLVSVKTETPEHLEKLQGLGFYGFMALGSHHQLHHHQMALGMSH